MKTQKLILGLLFLLAIGLFSSCVKYDRPAELSIDVQNLEFDNTNLIRQFNIMNMGDELLFVEVYSDRDWVTVNRSDVELLHAQTSLISVQINSEYFQDYGVYSAVLHLISNGGNFSIPIDVYFLPEAEPILAMDLDYLKFSNVASEDYFTLYYDGAEDMNFLLEENANWLQLSQNIGTIGPGGEKRIYVSVDRSGLSAGFYSTEINISTNGGNAVLNIDMDVAVYSITFFNPVYTTIEIISPDFNSVLIEPGERYTFLYNDNPSFFEYTATTKGETDDGTQLGLEIFWEEIIDVSAYNSPTFNLNVSPDYFFMAVKNTGNYYLDLWSVNYGNNYQIDDDFYIPNDGVEYGVAYYDAFEDTDIYARLSGTTDDVKWSQGIEFVFPWIENQYILLENNFKKSAIVRPSLKSSSDKQIKAKVFVKPIPKSKGSIDLYNKK